MTRRHRLALRILRRLAPRDAEATLQDLREETEGSGDSRRPGAAALLRFWVQVAGVCLYALRDRCLDALGGRPRPLRASRMALLGLRRSPGTAVTAVLTLGIGLSATVALLGVVHGMFRPLPVPGGDEIVRGELRTLRGSAAPVTPEVLAVWRQPAPGLARAGAFRVFSTTLDDRTGYARRHSGAAMTPEVLRLLEVPPVLGRLPTAEPSDRGAIVLGHDLWQERYGGSPDVLGASLDVEGRAGVVVGVMPRGFRFPYRQELWTVLDSSPADLGSVELVGRRLPETDPALVGPGLGATLASLPGAEAEGAPRRLTVASFVGGRGEGGEVIALAGLGVLVALLLAVCAANVSTLLLVRASERSRVLAVHAALGAPRVQVALQLLLESFWITVAGGTVGTLGGWAMLSWIERHMAVHWGYWWMRMEIRPGVLLWTGGVVLGTALLAGTVPVARALGTDIRGVLAAGSGRGRAGASSRTGRWFTGCQVALSTAGLVAAVFLASGVFRSSRMVESLPLDQVVVATVPLAGVLPDDPASRVEAVASLTREMEALGWGSVSVGLPAFGAASASLELSGAPPAGPSQVTYWSPVDPAHFQVHGLDLRRGRLLRDGDGAGAPVAVVNESFVRRFLPDREPLGALLRLDGVHDEGEAARIVGVVADHVPDQAGARNDRVFVPLEGRAPASVTLSLRVDPGGDAGRVLREAVGRADARLPVEDVRTLRDLMDYLRRVPRTVGLFGAFGGLAGVLVAAVGLYGVIAFGVRNRLAELGVRMALGAGGGRILGQVVAEGVRRVLPGLAVGLGLGFAVSWLLAAFLFGLSPTSVPIYVGVAAGMLAVAAAASLAPAVRAARLDPLTVLRTE